MIFTQADHTSQPLGAASTGLPRPKRPGVAAIELAMLAPLVAMLVLGTFELSRGLLVKQVLSDAVRKGCRTGIQPSTANAAIIADVNNILSDNNISSSGATITIKVNGVVVDASTAKQGDQISVKVSIPISQVFWAGTVYLSGSTIDSETIVMMRQG
jgi:Flp pilus assembly protein TadG